MLRRFAGQAGYALVLRALWAGISFISAALFARWFTAHDYGNYASITSLITFLSVVCGLGMPNALVRMIGEFGGDAPRPEQAGLAHGAIRAAHAGALLASVGTALLIVAGALLLYKLGAVPEPLVYVAGAVLLPAFTLTDVQAAAARSYGQVFTALAPRDVIWRLLLIPLAWVITRGLPHDQQLVSFLVLGAVGLTLLSLGQAWSLRRAAPARIWAAKPVYRLRHLVSVSASTWVTQVCGAVFRSADVVIASIFLPAHQVGLYFAASRVAALISFVLVSTNLIVGPEVAKLHFAGSQAHLNRMLKLAAMMIFLPSLVAFVLCVGFPDQVLGLFGRRFGGARIELIILSAGQLVNAATGCVGLVLQMTGFERKNAEILVTSSIATVIGLAVLTPLYGTVGTAVAMSAGVSISNLRMWLVARARTAYDPSIFGLLRRVDEPTAS